MELVEVIFPKAPPYHARNIVCGVVRGLALKAAANGEPWEVVNSTGVGRKGAIWKIEKKGKKGRQK